LKRPDAVNARCTSRAAFGHGESDVATAEAAQLIISPTLLRRSNAD
jgi:hypothetical protein